MQSIPRLLVAAILIAAAALVHGADRVAWRDAPEYVRLFAPANQRKSHSISVTDAPLADVLAQVTADPAAVAAPGSWQPRNESPQDAFGTAGLYNRWRAARVYGSGQPRVARGARMDRGRIVEAWTLVSPYPSADLAALHPGTMRLILKVP